MGSRGVCPVSPWEGVKSCPLLWSCVEGLVWSGGDGYLEGKSHLVTYTELVPQWPQVVFVLEGIRCGNVKNQMYVGKK